MASDIPLHIIDDEDQEDEFDWEAAVREIDKACENTKPSSSTSSSSSSSSSSYFGPPLAQISKKNTSRQSTLDRFIGKVGPRPPSDNQRAAESDEKVASVDIDTVAAKTWIYPVNVPLRDYQFAITKTALFSNTLVALPTGLGKTLIAAVVIYNYFRWFPDGKIVFAAPSRPLVVQQIEACHNIVGIPQEWTIDMTGQICPTRRASFWKTKRVFFVTPQVLEKDIQSGTCLAKYLVCLVIDEAHRALGNYSYCVAVRELMAMSVQLRILALTATPGSKQPAIQQIIDNLYISTLEYRNESDHDVSPYVHNRKIELIEVPLGQDATEVNNWLLEVIRPYVARLHAIGLIQNRDYQTLSPVDLLNSRDKFRQAPPLDLPHVKHGEVEAFFAVLLTLYHIRKLLSSHGIRPAYEMLEEKLQQGHFSRLMSKNEDIMKAKLLMQRSLSHGAPSPKLSKMLEVLINHFQTKDPRNSRVIIFSNFRGSVRDIMNALASIGDLVKAMEFIGQSSGKTLKGQSQKVQQAVLEKFRAGGYNVIVATSIGEEGLDIMEVDLVICFDANVSPLRMIQRMGRTGRKHDGRVVVLACQGSELKGYMRKQANSRSINKHMQNGGMNSFNFHSSPRMIPHVFKPEVQFVELSIEKFVPRGKKLKDDDAVETPFRAKLTVEETDLIAKYFHPTRESTWRASLIAFPNFQAFPSKVCKVMHSCRTEILIDSMQYLQGLTFPGGSGNFFVEEEVSSGDCFRVGIVEKHDSRSKDSLVLDNSSATNARLGISDSAESPTRTLRAKEKHGGLGSGFTTLQAHSYLFGSDFVSVDALGKVLIISVPSLNFEDVMHSNFVSPSIKELQSSLKQDTNHVKTSDGIMQTEAVPNITASQTKSIKVDTVSTPRFCEIDSEKEKMHDGVENIPETPGDTCETPDIKKVKAPKPLADEHCSDLRDIELSPRLTNLIKVGIVPESPITDSGLLKQNIRNGSLIPDLESPPELCTELLLRSSSPVENERGIMDNSPCGRKVLVMKDDMTPLLKMNLVSSTKCKPAPLLVETTTPSTHLTNSSGSKSWHLSSGEKAETIEHARMFKRLRKVGDCGKGRSSNSTRENSFVCVANLAKSFSGASPIRTKPGRGKKKPETDVRTFIDEEAEVSTEADISSGEDDDNESDDDSFIDDRINPTAGSTQSESGRVDMMAIYRRSLLSQSPTVWQPTSAFTPECIASTSKDNGSGCSLVKTFDSLQVPQPECINQSARKNMELFQIEERISSDSMPRITNDFAIQNESMQSRKRKLSFFQLESIPAINLEQEFSFQSEVGGRESSKASEQPQVDKTTANKNEFDDYDNDDDQFYASLDLDAMEAQATLLLKNKSESSFEKQEIIAEPNLQNDALQGSPSFDLGIW